MSRQAGSRPQVFGVKGRNGSVNQYLDRGRAVGATTTVGSKLDDITRRFKDTLQNADSAEDVDKAIQLIKDAKVEGQATVNRIPKAREADRDQVRGVINTLIAEMTARIKEGVSGTNALGFGQTADALKKEEAKTRKKFNDRSKDVDELQDQAEINRAGKVETTKDRDVVGNEITKSFAKAAGPLYSEFETFQGKMKKMNEYMTTASKSSNEVAEEFKRAKEALEEVTNAIDAKALEDVFEKIRKAANAKDADELNKNNPKPVSGN